MSSSSIINEMYKTEIDDLEKKYDNNFKTNDKFNSKMKTKQNVIVRSLPANTKAFSKSDGKTVNQVKDMLIKAKFDIDKLSPEMKENLKIHYDIYKDYIKENPNLEHTLIGFYVKIYDSINSPGFKSNCINSYKKQLEIQKKFSNEGLKDFIASKITNLFGNIGKNNFIKEIVNVIKFNTNRIGIFLIILIVLLSILILINILISIHKYSVLKRDDAIKVEEDVKNIQKKHFGFYNLCIKPSVILSAWIKKYGNDKKTFTELSKEIDNMKQSGESITLATVVIFGFGISLIIPVLRLVSYFIGTFTVDISEYFSNQRILLKQNITVLIEERDKSKDDMRITALNKIIEKQEKIANDLLKLSLFFYDEEKTMLSSIEYGMQAEDDYFESDVNQVNNSNSFGMLY